MVSLADLANVSRWAQYALNRVLRQHLNPGLIEYHKGLNML